MLWWLIFCMTVGVVSTTVLLIMGRRRGGAPARETGVPVLPVQRVVPVPPGLPAYPWRRVGAAVIPGPIGKVSATWPLGVMEGSDDWVEIRIQPAWMAKLFGARPLRASRSDAVEVFPARGFWGREFVGIKVGEREAYFTCTGRAELLGHLQASGFRVSTTERKIIYLGSST